MQSSFQVNAARVGHSVGQPTNDATVLITGVAKGGTSVVAAIVDALGVYLGPPGELAIAGCFETHTFSRSVTEAGTRQYIADANKTHTQWGVKIANGTVLNYLDQVRNPCVIVVTRDPMAIATHMGYEKSLDAKAVDRVIEFCDQTMDILCKTRQSRVPYLVLSYERLKADPAGVVSSIVSFLSLNPTHDQVCEAVARINSRGGYLQLQ